MKNRETFSYEVYWDSPKGVTSLHSYAVVTKSTGARNVLVLSTLEPILGTTKDDKNKKPAIIELYNFTKGGTDIMDQVRFFLSNEKQNSKFFSNLKISV